MVVVGDSFRCRNAQVMRCGYHSFRGWISSFAMLASMLFVRSWDRGEAIFLSMDSRCYDGCMVLPEEECRSSPVAVVSVCVFLLAAAGLLVAEWRFL